MCGIAGIYVRDETKNIERDAIVSMCESIRHRGPDDKGYILEGNIGLGMRRLSVIDLTRGNQPIPNEDKTLWVILNGEIYNYLDLRSELIKRGHVFSTDSDTEVIVHLYEEKKEKCLDDLSGMFAFAVLDIRTKTLFIARDRLGVKPLYYYSKNNNFIFASELKAIINVPGFEQKLDLDALSCFFSLNYIPAPATVFKDTKQLLAGHYLVITKEGVKVKKYWDIHFDGYFTDREDAIVDQLEYLLKKTTHRMLKSDVPLGAFLSGGLDSSALVSLITESCGENLKTFSVGFQEDSYDETYFADLAAGAFGTKHHNVLCGPDDLIRDLPKIVWHADNLLADPAMLPLYCIAKLAREQVTVCISGDGGDELFSGYPTYLADTYLKYYRMIPAFIRKSVIEKTVGLLPVSYEKLSFEYRAKKFIEGARFPAGKAHYWWRTIFTDDEKKELFSEDVLREMTSMDSYPVYSRRYDNCFDKNIHPFNKFMYADLKVWLTDNNLIRVDAMSMAHSLEVRVPFLDHELVEFMARVPPELRMKNGQLKYLLKKAMRHRLPQQIIRRKKSGWHVPLAKWFHSDLRGYITEVLNDAKVMNSGFFKKGSIDKILEAHFKKKSNNAFKIWGLLVFSRWHDTFC
ncbi:MAG: asparagine synthase (glutamine-hydrolyzing) [Candidatus Omnitrophica bacterium]|nr:asparagine synthase (glutamine-hydrolyzing) [Candidatus Omnitrophota bacterium]